MPGLGADALIAPLTSAAQVAYHASDTDRCFEEWLVRLCSRAGKTTRSGVAKGVVQIIVNEADHALHEAVRAFATTHLTLRPRARRRRA